MPKSEALSIDSIVVEEIGQPREADVLYASIMQKLGRISMGGFGAELVAEECFMADAGLEPEHPPYLAAHWSSSELIEGTDIPRTVVKQITDPHVIGDWSIHHVSEPLSNGTPTIDHFGVHNARITVERHAQDKEASGYCEGIMEDGIVYSSELHVADMTRLRALDEALPAIVD